MIYYIYNTFIMRVIRSTTTTMNSRMPVRDLQSFWDNVDKSPMKKMSMFERYEEHGSPRDILRLAMLNSKSLGKVAEDFARYRFPFLKPSKSNEFDHIMTPHHYFNVEQKTSRLWENDDFKWQHIEPDHSWDYLLFCGIGYQDVQFWILTRANFHVLVKKAEITIQGSKKERTEKGSDEGYWCWYSDIKELLIPVHSEEQLRAYFKEEEMNDDS